MAFTKRAQLHTVLQGVGLDRLHTGEFVVQTDRTKPGGYDVAQELDDAVQFAAEVTRPEVTITIHVEGDHEG